MDDLVRWLGEQLDEDAARAQRAIDGPRNAFVSADEDVEPLLFDDDGLFVLPAQVLREIDAKRRVIAGLQHLFHGDDPFVTSIADDSLRLLAEVYASRPGYQDSWRP